MSYTILSHVATGDLATAVLHNQLIDDLAVLKTSINDDGRVDGEIKTFREEISSISSSSGTLTVNLSNGNNFKCTLTENITTITVSNWTASKFATVVLRLTQHASAAKTVAFPAGWKWASNVPAVMSTGLGKVDIIVLMSDDGGTTIFASAFTQNA